MKALTICQPYAELIACGEKRVENRTWYTPHRGALYIHAGKSKQWLDIEVEDGYEVDVPTGIHLDSMDFGGLIATANLVACLTSESILRGCHDEQYPWLRGHSHVNGPYCLVLADVKRLQRPIPCRGALGLWDVPAEIEARIAA